MTGETKDMIHQRKGLKRYLALVMVLVVSLPAWGLEMGKAEGTVTYKGQSCSLKHALAVEGEDGRTTLYLSDAPVSLEQVRNEDVDHEVAHLEITFDGSGKATYVSVRWGYSGSGTPKGVNFEGSFDRAKKKVSGKLFTKAVTINESTLEYSVAFEAPIQKL